MEEKTVMDEKLKARIAELDREIECYRQQILDAQGALDSAEKELDELLSTICEEGND